MREKALEKLNLFCAKVGFRVNVKMAILELKLKNSNFRIF